MSAFVVARAEEIPPGERRIVEVGGRSIGVFNVDGSYYALRNACPHQGAPLCLGSIQGTAEPSAPGEYVWGREGRIIRCPWHGWEFDLTTGRSVFNPHRTRVRSYRVTVERGTGGAAARPPEGTAEVATVEAGRRGAEEATEAVQTFPVTVEEGFVVLHI